MNKLCAFAIITVAVGCSDQRDPVPGPAQVVVLHMVNGDAVVDLTTFTLITRDLAADTVDAFRIMRVKRARPLAMHTRRAEDFERILARDFIFRAEGEFYDRAGYIRDRVSGRDTVGHVRYENLVLQVMGDLALLTYRNHVRSQDSLTYPNEHMSWADMYVKEDGRWMIGASHLIEYRSP